MNRNGCHPVTDGIHFYIMNYGVGKVGVAILGIVIACSIAKSYLYTSAYVEVG